MRNIKRQDTPYFFMLSNGKAQIQKKVAPIYNCSAVIDLQNRYLLPQKWRTPSPHLRSLHTFWNLSCRAVILAFLLDYARALTSKLEKSTAIFERKRRVAAYPLYKPLIPCCWYTSFAIGHGPEYFLSDLFRSIWFWRRTLTSSAGWATTPLMDM